MDWCTIGFTVVIVVCVAAAVVWIAGQIDQIEEHTERFAAGIALAGVPTAIVLLVIKVCQFSVKLVRLSWCGECNIQSGFLYINEAAIYVISTLSC